MKNFVYDEATIAFVTAAAQACLLIEKSNEHERGEWREQMLRLLPVLYLRARLLDQEEELADEEPQRFVTEEDYNFALVGIRELMGSDDAYLDVFVDQGVYTDEVPANTKLREIKAVWCAPGKPAWSYETDIPHEKFNIYEDGELFCEGIVFSLEDLRETKKYVKPAPYDLLYEEGGANTTM